jgi:2-dehydropantoate 2-reductase
MRVVVVGAGGVGGIVGGLLSRAGVDVAFVARGAQLAAMRERGLHVESVRGTFQLEEVEVSQDPASLAPADVVLVAVKAWQVPELAPKLAPLLARDGFVVPLENGVDSADTLARALGGDRVVGGLCHMLAWVEAPGMVRQDGEILRVILGERRGDASPRIEALARALRGAGVEAAVSDDVEAASWEKLVFIAAFGGVGAVTRAPVGVVRAIPETRSLLRTAMEETAAVGRARGVRVSPEAVPAALAIIDRLPPDATASMQRDIQAGRPSELMDQNGAVVRKAGEAAVPVPVPVHAFLLAALLPQERTARRAATV